LFLCSLRECVASLAGGNQCPQLSAWYVNIDLVRSFPRRDCFEQEMYLSFYVGEEALAVGLLGNATLHLRIAGRHLARALERPTQQLMIDLLDVIRLFSRAQYMSYTMAIYRFLITIVRYKLGPQHPLSTVVALLVQHADDVHWQIATWESMVSADPSEGAGLCHYLRLQAQSYFGMAMEVHDLLGDSIEINQELLEQEVAMLGPRHRSTRGTMIRLGRLYYKSGKTRKAINGLERALQLIRERPSLHGDDYVHLLIYGELACAHEKLGNYEAALNWYWKAFKESTARFGPLHEDTIWHLNELFDFLESQDKIKKNTMLLAPTIDLTQIKDDYAESYRLLTQGLENLNLEDSSPLQLDMG
jgi:tetratricopeptide (TPR) repeat protein